MTDSNRYTIWPYLKCDHDNVAIVMTLTVKKNDGEYLEESSYVNRKLIGLSNSSGTFVFYPYFYKSIDTDPETEIDNNFKELLNDSLYITNKSSLMEQDVYFQFNYSSRNVVIDIDIEPAIVTDNLRGTSRLLKYTHKFEDMSITFPGGEFDAYMDDIDVFRTYLNYLEAGYVPVPYGNPVFNHPTLELNDSSTTTTIYKDLNSSATLELDSINYTIDDPQRGKPDLMGVTLKDNYTIDKNDIEIFYLCSKSIDSLEEEDNVYNLVDAVNEFELFYDPLRSLVLPTDDSSKPKVFEMNTVLEYTDGESSPKIRVMRPKDDPDYNELPYELVDRPSLEERIASDVDEDNWPICWNILEKDELDSMPNYAAVFLKIPYYNKYKYIDNETQDIDYGEYESLFKEYFYSVIWFDMLYNDDVIDDEGSDVNLPPKKDDGSDFDIDTDFNWEFPLRFKIDIASYIDLSSYQFIVLSDNDEDYKQIFNFNLNGGLNDIRLDLRSNDSYKIYVRKVSGVVLNRNNPSYEYARFHRLETLFGIPLFVKIPNDFLPKPFITSYYNNELTVMVDVDKIFNNPYIRTNGIQPKLVIKDEGGSTLESTLNPDRYVYSMSGVSGKVKIFSQVVYNGGDGNEIKVPDDSLLDCECVDDVPTDDCIYCWIDLDNLTENYDIDDSYVIDEYGRELIEKLKNVDPKTIADNNSSVLRWYLGVNRLRATMDTYLSTYTYSYNEINVPKSVKSVGFVYNIVSDSETSYDVIVKYKGTEYIVSSWDTDGYVIDMDPNDDQRILEPSIKLSTNDTLKSPEIVSFKPIFIT